MPKQSKKINIIKPQKGFQEQFLSSSADIVIGGGSAGSGKSFALLMEPLRHHQESDFGGVIFRRTRPEIIAEQGLWDTSKKLYLDLPINSRPTSNETLLQWLFPSGFKLRFSHLQHEKHKLGWQGAQIGYLGFDELTHFTKSQFFYLLTRNRSASGIKPYCRATTNPQGHGWVKRFIQWFIYPDDYYDQRLAGYPIPERIGKLLYFTSYKSNFVFGKTPIEVLEQLPADIAKEYDIHSIKSFTFIPGLLSDNKILSKNDPGYKANLLAQEDTLMQQLLLGRWLASKDDELRIFNYNALVDLFTNSFVPRGKRYITADIAMQGKDNFVIVVWEGWVIIDIIIIPISDGPSVINSIKQASIKYGVPGSRIAFDSGGVGNYLKGFMRSSYAIFNNAKPLPYQGLKQSFKNLRSQLYYYAAQKVNNYEMYIAPDLNDTIQDKIIEQLYAHKKKEIGALVISLIPKKEIIIEIGHSPDIADNIAMRSVFDIAPKKGKGKAAAG